VRIIRIRGDYLIKTVKLTYAALNCRNVKKMVDYYENVIGLTVVESTNDDTFYLSTGLEHHNLVLTSSENSELSTIGFHVSADENLLEIQTNLKAQGIQSELKHDFQPGVHELLELEDPDGYKVHLLQNIEMPAPGFKKNSICPQKLGHIALGSLNPELSNEFYMKVLNFKHTDRIGERAIFLTCNSDHHVLNISKFGHKMMHHIAFELKDSSHHTLSADFLSQNGKALSWGPFRHTAGHNLASYHHDPELNVIELFTDMDQFIPELNYFDPRPWHAELPMRPKVWENNCTWYDSFEKNITDYVLDKVQLSK